MANELMLSSPVTSFFQGQQGAQQQQMNAQQQQANQFALQQAQQGAQRDDQFRNALQAYLTGGSNSLAALYSADPQRAAQFQALQLQQQQQQNELAREKRVREAKEGYAGATYVLTSDAPKTLAEVQFPDIVEQLKANGFDWDAATDEDVRGLATRMQAQYGAAAGIAPEFSAPEAVVVDGQERLVQVDTATGRPRVIPGIAPRPQRPLVQVDTGMKAESEANKAYGKAEGEAYSALIQRGQDAGDKVSTLRAMKDNPAITGPTQDFRASANTFFADLGVPIAPDKINQIANLTQYKGILNQAVLTEQIKQKGPQTESDAKRIMQSFGSTKNIQEANKLVLNYQLALADREILLADMADEYRLRTGQIDGWRKVLRDYVRDTPLAGVDPQSKRLVFWNEFMEGMKEDNPGMSDEDIMGYWRKRYGGAR